MRITPLELRNHAFRHRLRGYDATEVDEFLRFVAEDYEKTLRHLEAQRAEIAQLEQKVEALTANEQVLQETLTLAQRLSEDLKRTSMKEAEVIVSEAEIRGEKVLDAAHRRASKLAEDIREMKQLKVRLTASVRAAIETHLTLLDSLAVEPPEESELENKVTYLGQGPRDPRRREPGGGGTPPQGT